MGELIRVTFSKKTPAAVCAPAKEAAAPQGSGVFPTAMAASVAEEFERWCASTGSAFSEVSYTAFRQQYDPQVALPDYQQVNDVFWRRESLEGQHGG